MSTHPVSWQEAGLNINNRTWAEIPEIGQSKGLGEEIKAGLSLKKYFGVRK
jgi:hypothetical protein